MSLLKDKNFQTRIITGILFVGVVVAGILISEQTYNALLFAINLLCLIEFYNLTIEKHQTFFKVYLLSVVVFLSGVLLFFIPIPAYFTLAGPVLLFLIVFIQLAYQSKQPFANIAFAFFGMIYISIPLALLFLNTDDPINGYNPKLALLLFMLVWINDTGAYMAGNLIGKTKLFARISPKKTWEGFIGGVLLSMFVAALYGKYALLESPLLFCGLGLVIGIFSTLGDLIESQLKRSLNRKDSGTLLPGHGGFLDRFDGFLIAMPAAYFYLTLVSNR